MKVFITGATGNIGTQLVPLLVARGHNVTGLCRSEKSAESLKKQGGTPVIGNLKTLDVIETASRNADAVVHLAFNHDFDAKYSMEDTLADDLNVINTVGNALKGTNKVFIGTCGTLDFTIPNADHVLDDTEAKPSPVGRGINEKALLDFAKEGVKAMCIRLPSFVYGNNIWGFCTMAIDSAKKAGTAYYVGEGAGRFNATHVEDAAQVYALAITKGHAGAIYSAVSDNTPTYKDLATAVGKLLKLEAKSLPTEQATQTMGPWMTFAFSSNNPSSSSRAAKDLGWVPVKKTNILDDIAVGSYAVRAQ